MFGMIGCLAVYFAGSRLFERRVGLISSAVLATSALWYVMGHVINLDMAVSANCRLERESPIRSGGQRTFRRLDD